MRLQQPYNKPKGSGIRKRRGSLDIGSQVIYLKRGKKAKGKIPSCLESVQLEQRRAN